MFYRHGYIELRILDWMHLRFLGSVATIRKPFIDILRKVLAINSIILKKRAVKCVGNSAHWMRNNLLAICCFETDHNNSGQIN